MQSLTCKHKQKIYSICACFVYARSKGQPSEASNVFSTCHRARSSSLVWSSKKCQSNPGVRSEVIITHERKDRTLCLQHTLFLHSLSLSFYLPKKRLFWIWPQGCLFIKSTLIKILKRICFLWSAVWVCSHDVVGEGTVSSAFWALTVCLYALFSLSHVQTYLYTLCNIAERLFFPSRHDWIYCILEHNSP